MMGDQYHTQPLPPPQVPLSLSLWTPVLFAHQVSSGVSFLKCVAAWCKAASFEKTLSKVTLFWKHTIKHSVLTPDAIVIQLTLDSVPLAKKRKEIATLSILFIVQV